MVRAESTAGVYDRLRQAATGLHLVPDHPGLTLIRQHAEQTLLDSGLKLIEADAAAEAKEIARRMLDIDPNSAPASVLQAQAERALGNLAAAEAAAAVLLDGLRELGHGAVRSARGGRHVPGF